MPMAPSEIYYREFGGLNEKLEVVVGKVSGIVVLWNTQLQCHRRERRTNIMLVDMGNCKLAEGILERAGCVEHECLAHIPSAMKDTYSRRLQAKC